MPPICRKRITLPIEMMPAISEKKIMGAISIFSRDRKVTFRKLMISVTQTRSAIRSFNSHAARMPSAAAMKTCRVRFLAKNRFRKTKRRDHNRLAGEGLITFAGENGYHGHWYGDAMAALNR